MFGLSDTFDQAKDGAEKGVSLTDPENYPSVETRLFTND